MYKTGRLGSNYQDIYFLKEIIHAGDYCVDIGAHLGYYTFELSRRVKQPGKVYAIEPISKFNHTIKKILEKKKIHNVELYQCALGGNSEFVEMGIPQIGNMKKFAYARIMESEHALNYVETEKVKNEKADELFKDLPRLDFVKCDVEGFEIPVFSSMMKTLEKHLPIILCELADKNDRIKLFEMLSPLGYHIYFLEGKRLHLQDPHTDGQAISHNHYFIPQFRVKELEAIIRRQ